MRSFMPWAYLLATAGSPFAFAMNGVEAYRQGNYPLAAETLITESANDPIANYYLGRMYLYGYGQLKNDPLALSFFNKAAEKGVLDAQLLLAKKALNEKDFEKALTWFKKAASQNDINAEMYCSAAYRFGVGTKKNIDLARKYYIDAARNGNNLAQYALAMDFLDSRNLRNKKVGLSWLMKAVAVGNVDAEAKLGELYLGSPVVKAAPEKAIPLLVKAANQNSTAAMITLGQLAIKQDQLDTGIDWLKKASNLKDMKADLALATLYTNPKSKLYNVNEGFMWTLKAAQNGSKDAALALASMYKEGKGVTVNAGLATEWQEKAKKLVNLSQVSDNSEELAAKWLSENHLNNLKELYPLGGIYNDWQNKKALQANNYNKAPQMDMVNRNEIFKPQFKMTIPSEVAINDYFDLVAPYLNSKQGENWSFPHYALNNQIQALQESHSFVLKDKKNSFVMDTGRRQLNEDSIGFNYLAEKTKDWQKEANYQAVLSQLYGQAILGNSNAQYELGQLYQYGIAVLKSPEQALVYYQLAAAQQDLRAEYNIALIYLQGQTNPLDYQQGVNWLTDAAFKGNVYAQYALANIYDKGFKDKEGNLVIQPDKQQAMAMYYLASSNRYGPAEYNLAEYLVRQRQSGLTVAAKENRAKLIRRLYAGAANQGVAEAGLPLAFYNAMDSDVERQKEAFAVAKKEAKKGNKEAALLLGMLYDRGVSVPQNQSEALYWFQQAGMGPVNDFILGTYYSAGIGIAKDKEKGRALLQQAANAGFSYANLNLAILKAKAGEDFLPDLQKSYEIGNAKAGLLLADNYLANKASDVSNMQQALTIYEGLAEKGDKDAELKLAYLYDTGLAGQQDINQATKWYGLAAEQGQPIAQYLLGQVYQLGKIGKSPNYAEAKKWYKLSAKNYPKASVALGFVYETVEDNYPKAMENYDSAAKAANPVGQFNLGLMYEDGKGMPVNQDKAKDLYSKASEKFNAAATDELASMYFNGNGVERNEQQALALYKKAAALGDSGALYQLGLLSETGVATKLDFIKAISYYEEAARKGNIKAKLALARMYQYGLGAPKNLALAANLYKELAATDNAYAQYQLALILLNSADKAKNEEAKHLLQEAAVNGSQSARKMLQWQAAQQQVRTSFIEPIAINQAPILATQPANMMYLDALSEWNKGDEDLSRLILNRLMTEFPQYMPARRAFEQLNQHSTGISVVFNDKK